MEINSISTQKNLDLELTLFLDSDDKNELNDKKSKCWIQSWNRLEVRSFFFFPRNCTHMLPGNAFCLPVRVILNVQVLGI